MPLSLGLRDLPNGDCALPASPTGSPPNARPARPEITVTPAASQTEGTLDRSGPGPRPPRGEAMEGPPRTEPRQAPAGSAAEPLPLEEDVAEALLRESDEASELKPVELDAFEGNITKQLVKRLTSAEAPAAPGKLPREGPGSGEADGCRPFLDDSLEDALHGLFLALEPHKGQYREFQELSQEVTRLDDILKVSASRGLGGFAGRCPEQHSV